MRYGFINDYSEGACPEIIQALTQTNLQQTTGYGIDPHCENARQRIMAQLGRPVAAVHFLVGGTQTNTTAIAAVLRPHQGVVAAVTGHINVHESGAIESTGHKVLALPAPNGKLTAEAVRACFAAHYADANAEHTVQPGMVYVSQPTELGTLYSKAELTAIAQVCRTYHAPLYLDGARLGCALTAAQNDLTLADIAALTDLFYIGGTKMGAMFGEALVIVNEAYAKDFRYILKQHGGMLAKGRLLGIQFETLFDGDLYFRLARHANAMTARLAEGIAKLGYGFLAPASTNQLFPIFPDAMVKALEADWGFEFWEKTGADTSAIRFCCSWATDPAMVEALLEDIAAKG